MFDFLKRLTGSKPAEQEQTPRSCPPKKKSQIEKFKSRYQEDVFSERERSGFRTDRKQTSGKLNSTKRSSHRKSVKSFADLSDDPFDK